MASAEEKPKATSVIGDVSFKTTETSAKQGRKQKCLVFASRGISRQERHLLMDIRTLLPHHKGESKLDEKKHLANVIPEMCMLKGCNSCIFLENRKRKDLYMWISQVPDGPTAKFLVSNVHTMDELKMPGNCLKGSRPVLHFDQPFQELPELQVLRALLTQTFGTPMHHPNSKPFIDHIFGFYYLKGRIWFRNFQIVEQKLPGTKKIERSLLEIGPRFVLQPIRIFDGCFVGRSVWTNSDFVSPNKLRAQAKEKASKYVQHKRAARKREKWLEGEGKAPEPSPADRVFK
eukprot:Sspe_Gene.51095::Locus_28386_Transcript_2_2_Confidence_0.875_Length_964::g.51095::m.51095/K14820/BRX1, BRIX1; ribosome biogenesis protein BRX1